METTKPKTVDYEYEGKKYRLTCNMAVIGDVQEAYNGKLLQALNQTGGYKSTLTFLAAMLTDAADSQEIKDEDGLPLVFTAREVGRKLTLREVNEVGRQIWPLIEDAVMGKQDDAAQEDAKKTDTAGGIKARRH